MCTDAQLTQHMSEMTQHISSLTDALRPAPTDKWETSEPMIVGGPSGQYTLKSPFVGDSQYMIDFVNATAVDTALLSSTYKTSLPAFATTDQPVGGYSPLDGLLIATATGGVNAVTSQWYNLRNSSSTLYLLISTPGAMYLNIQFRQKRG